MDVLELDFEQAKARHIQFKTRLRSILYGAEIDEAPVLSHHECAVGKWIYEQALGRYGHIPEIIELEHVHARIHTCARELVALYRSGKVDQARDGLAEMESIATHLIELLERAEAKIKLESPRLKINEDDDTLKLHSEQLLDLHRTIKALDTRISEQTTIAQAVKREIEESDNRFRHMVHQAPVGIAILRGADFIVELANAAYLQIADRDEKTLVGNPLFDTLPEVRVTVEPLLANVMATGEPFYADELQVPIKRFGRIQTGFFNIVYQALREPDNSITGIIVVANDVTEMVNAKHLLRESEARFRNIITRSPIAMTIFRGEDFIVDIANDTLLNNIWLRKLEDVQGRKLLDIFPELRDQKFPALLRQVYASGVTYTESEAVALIDTPEGPKKYYLDFDYSPLFGTDGKIYAIMVTVNDVSAKVHAREQIADAAERLLLATEGTLLGTWDLNLQSGVIVHSPRLAIIFGFDETKKISHTELRSFVHPEDEKNILLPAFTHALETGRYLYEVRLMHPDKTIHWLRTNGKIIFDKNNTPLRMVGTSTDITEEKTHRQAQDEIKERLNLVISASELGIWEINLVNGNVAYSDRYKEIFGFGANAVVTNAEVLSRVPPEYLEVRKKAIEESRKTGTLNFESPVFLDDESVRWVEAKGKVLFESGIPTKLIGTLRDATKERTARLQIEESERRFRSVADTAPVLIRMATQDKLFNFFNKAWLNFTARTMAEESGNGWTERVHPEDLERCLNIFSTAFDKHDQFYMEYRLLRHDGTYRWVNDNGVPRFTGENFEGYIIAGMDIHERIIFEENLKESESRLRIAALSSDLGTWSFNPKTRELFWDEQSKAMFNLGPDAPVDVDLFWSRVHPDDREPSLKKMRRALDPELQETYDMEYRNILPDSDRIRWIHAKGKAIFDDNNEPYVFSGTILDITEKRIAIEELQESETKFRFLSNAMPQFIWTGNETGVLDYFNDAVYSYSGLSREEIAKEGWLQIVHPDEQEQNIAQWIHAVATGEDFLFEHRFRRHDGVYRWQLSRAVAQRNSEGKIQMWIGTSTDIHDRKMFSDNLETQVEQRTKELKSSMEELRRTNSELEQFAYVASHDLQEPLRKIQTFATRILEIENEKLSAKGQDYLSRLQASSKRMQQLILDLLAFSRASNTDKNLEQTDLNLLVEKVKDQLSELIEKNHVTVKSSVLPDVNVIVFQFEQLLTNLIGNAVKFARTNVPCIISISAGSVKGSELVHPQADPQLNYKFVTVSDNGIGFDQQFSERIFQVFQRLHSKDTYEGTGIGLAICKKIAENHNGFIVALGKPGEGASFTIYIPA